MQLSESEARKFGLHILQDEKEEYEPLLQKGYYLVNNLDAGYDIDFLQGSPLHFALYGGHVYSIFRFLQLQPQNIILQARYGVSVYERDDDSLYRHQIGDGMAWCLWYCSYVFDIVLPCYVKHVQHVDTNLHSHVEDDQMYEYVKFEYCDMTLLHIAMYKELALIADKLYSFGANIDATMKDGRSCKQLNRNLYLKVKKLFQTRVSQFCDVQIKC